mmetsp:Transcript_8807/g.20025  ORF Transcript_8807/g.20025 Transcript_8807/m.20025 type:complete len:405 (-) Transcript_8807:760-1974(-)
MSLPIHEHHTQLLCENLDPTSIPSDISYQSSHEYNDIVHASQRLVTFMRDHCGSHAQVEKLLRQERDRALSDCENLATALDELWTEHSKCTGLSIRARDSEEKEREYKEMIGRLREHIVQIEYERDQARRSHADVCKLVEELKFAEKEMKSSYARNEEVCSKYAALLERYKGCEQTIGELRKAISEQQMHNGHAECQAKLAMEIQARQEAERQRDIIANEHRECCTIIEALRNEIRLMKTTCGIGIYVARTSIDSRVRVSKVHPGGAAWYARHTGDREQEFLEPGDFILEVDGKQTCDDLDETSNSCQGAQDSICKLKVIKCGSSFAHRLDEPEEQRTCLINIRRAPRVSEAVWKEDLASGALFRCFLSDCPCSSSSHSPTQAVQRSPIVTSNMTYQGQGRISV